MTKASPMVSVIVPARPDQSRVLSVEAAAHLSHSPGKLEILLARGPQPSIQRNKAVEEAKGEWIYFLDDDSIPDPDNLKRARELWDEPDVVMIGGPNVCPDNAPLLQQAFARVMGNRLAFGPSAARYRPVGERRTSGEKELILCNLMARRSAFRDAGGFDENLYPNEENALMDAFAGQGGKLIYDPNFVVERNPRSSLRDFIRMLMNYGRGRAEQFRLHPTTGSILNFIPPLFVLYLLGLVAVLPLACPCLTALLLAPLVPYAALVGWFSWGESSASEDAHWVDELFHFLVVPALVIATHIFYGLGFWKGLFTQLGKGPVKRDIPVTIEHIHV